MQLEPGRELLHYRLIDKLGEGGMGVVWRAQDTTLDREVAIKVLPDIFGDQPERLARFEREARVLASLTHPNIATIHGLHEVPATSPGQPGLRFLAMELAVGEDLSKRLARGALPIDEALRVALAIAQALEAAHDQGIVHRDLKPANVVLSDDDQVKVLDFGLAKALDPGLESQSGASPTMSPTLTSAGTVVGMVLGTAAYMSPEQAKGKTVDRRADIWAFGVTLHEMLTGRQLYEGETVSETLAAVMMTEPSMDTLPAATPPRVRRLLERCLTRDPKARLRDIGEARITLERAIAGEPEALTAAEQTPAAAPSIAGRLLAFGAVALAAIVAGFFLGKSSAPAAPDPPVRRFEIDAPASMRNEQLTLSPDGRKLAFTSAGRLWVRSLDQLQARAVEGADGAGYPFWSPDGRWIGYADAVKLWKIPVEGGTPVLITELPDAFDAAAGAAWLPGDRIVLGTGDTGLFEVSALGGDLARLHPTTENETDLHNPSVLPGGRGFLFVPHRVDGGLDTISVFADGERKNLLTLEGQTIRYPIYARSGHLLFHRSPDNRGIWAVPFSLASLETTGPPFLVAPDSTFPSVSEDGTLAFRTRAEADAKTQLVWMDRSGEVVGTVGEPELQSAFPALSPDGRTIATRVGSDEESELWLHDVQRGTETRLTFEEGREGLPFWSPDGSRVYYQKGRATAVTIYSRARDGSAKPEEILSGGYASISPDGRYLLASRYVDSNWGIWYLDLEKRGEPVLVVGTESTEYMPRVSPDGRYVAYVSRESDRDEIYVKKFPSGEGKWQVSVAGGLWPRWSRDGKELFYVRGNDLMTVDVETSGSLVLGTPRRLFTRPDSGMVLPLDWDEGFDVSADGQRFLVLRRAEGEQTAVQRPSITIVENWVAEFD